MFRCQQVNLFFQSSTSTAGVEKRNVMSWVRRQKTHVSGNEVM